MILQKMELTIKAEWLDPEGIHVARRRMMVAERLLKMFSHEFAQATTDRYGVKIEIVAIDGFQFKEPSEIFSSDEAQEVDRSGQ